MVARWLSASQPGLTHSNHYDNLKKLGYYSDLVFATLMSREIISRRQTYNLKLKIVNLIGMNIDDMVYYLHTNKNGTPIKFAAIVLGQESDGILIRVGRYDVHSKEVSTFESVVPEAALQPRSVPCSYEDELQGQA